jgi:hypothetical protein
MKIKMEKRLKIPSVLSNQNLQLNSSRRKLTRQAIIPSLRRVLTQFMAPVKKMNAVQMASMARGTQTKQIQILQVMSMYLLNKLLQ